MAGWVGNNPYHAQRLKEEGTPKTERSHAGLGTRIQTAGSMRRTQEVLSDRSTEGEENVLLREPRLVVRGTSECPELQPRSARIKLLRTSVRRSERNEFLRRLRPGTPRTDFEFHAQRTDLGLTPL